MGRLIKTEEAAAILGVHVSSISYRVDKGHLTPAGKDKWSWLFDEDDVMQLLESIHLKQCQQCGVDLGHDAHQNRKYCSPKCRKTAHMERNPKTYAGPQARNNRLRKLYGITEDDYDIMLAAQGNRCAICGTDDPSGRWGRFHVDHCHETGRVRGLLCGPCNTGVGHMSDDVTRLSSAIRYLKGASWVVVDVWP